MTLLIFRPCRVRLMIAQVLTPLTATYAGMHGRGPIEFKNDEYSNLWCDIMAISDDLGMEEMSDEDIDSWFKVAIRLGIKYEPSDKLVKDTQKGEPPFNLKRKLSAEEVRDSVAMWQREGWTSGEQKKAGRNRAAMKYGKLGLFFGGMLLGVNFPLSE